MRDCIRTASGRWFVGDIPLIRIGNQGRIPLELYEARVSMSPESIFGIVGIFAGHQRNRGNQYGGTEPNDEKHHANTPELPDTLRAAPDPKRPLNWPLTRLNSDI
jgi:hypothetical protein